MTKAQEGLAHYDGEPILIKKIDVSDIRPELPGPNESLIILQRNAKDDRRTDSSDFGALERSSAEQTRASAKKFFDSIFSKLNQRERADVDIMVMASDATLVTPDGLRSQHQRAVETADEVIAGLKDSMAEHLIAAAQFLNNGATLDGQAIKISELRDLKILEDSPEFVKFLADKYGTEQAFWLAYESDQEKSTRLAMNAEGPEEIADRINYALALQAQIAEEHHRTHPGQRLIIWAVGHYDCLSPFIKKHVLGKDPSQTYLPIEYGGGVSMHLGKNGQISCTINDQKINLSK